MPRGIYPRNQARKIKKAIKPLIKSPSKHRKLNITILYGKDGVILLEKVVVHSWFKAMQLVIENYVSEGIPIHEVRIGNV